MKLQQISFDDASDIDDLISSSFFASGKLNSIDPFYDQSAIVDDDMSDTSTPLGASIQLSDDTVTQPISSLEVESEEIRVDGKGKKHTPKRNMRIFSKPMVGSHKLEYHMRFPSERVVYPDGNSQGPDGEHLQKCVSLPQVTKLNSSPLNPHNGTLSKSVTPPPTVESEAQILMESPVSSRKKNTPSPNSDATVHQMTKVASPRTYRRVEVMDKKASVGKKQNRWKVKKDDALLLWILSGVCLSLEFGEKRFAIVCHTMLPTSDYQMERGSLKIFETRTPIEIARQLTLFQHSIYSNITPREFLLWASSKKKEIDCPQIFAIVSHFNRIASWICACVVTKMRLEERKNIYGKCIEVCRHLLDLNNFLALQVGKCII